MQSVGHGLHRRATPAPRPNEYPQGNLSDAQPQTPFGRETWRKAGARIRDIDHAE